MMVPAVNMSHGQQHDAEVNELLMNVMQIGLKMSQAIDVPESFDSPRCFGICNSMTEVTGRPGRDRVAPSCVTMTSGLCHEICPLPERSASFWYIYILFLLAIYLYMFLCFHLDRVPLDGGRGMAGVEAVNWTELP